MSKALPPTFKKYFWDTDQEKIDLNKNKQYIIERLLELGDLQELEWINKTYDKTEITRALQNSKRISPKTGNFFSLYYDIPKESILCMRKHSI